MTRSGYGKSVRRRSGKPRKNVGVRASPSTLETRFEMLWNHVAKGPKLEREVQFCPSRRWRFDFAHRPTMLAFEMEGGVWSRGRHLRPIGFVKDCEKYNAATLLGWRVFRIPAPLMTPDYILEIKAHLFGIEPFYPTNK
jgi:hypothetical protein